MSKNPGWWLSWLVPAWLTAAGAAAALEVGEHAPLFTLQNQDGGEFSLDSRRGAGWTVLYFYPKAGTPGCTQQACAYRDGLAAIRQRQAEVYGVSTDTVADLAAFRRKHQLNFTLLADADAAVTSAYGVKMPLLSLAKRWTFIIDPALVVRAIDDDVDPVLDAQRVAQRLETLQRQP